MTAKIEGWPKVAGYCPACGTASLFLGSGGWVTCSLDKCPNPTAVADLIEHRRDLSVPPPQPNPSVSVGDKRNGYPCPKDGATLILLPGGAWCPECHTVWREIADLPMTGVAPPPRPVVSSARVDLDLDQVEARASAATAGPWQEFYGSMSDGEQRYYVGQVGPTVSVNDVTGDGMPRADAEFIAHAREDVPRLVAEVKRLRFDLHDCERIRQEYEDERDEARAEAARVREALQAERKHHMAVWRECVLDGEVWPCASVRALDAALDGTE